MSESNGSNSRPAANVALWAVMLGNFVDGYRVIGPFGTREVATEWAAKTGKQWIVTPMLVPLEVLEVKRG